MWKGKIYSHSHRVPDCLNQLYRHVCRPDRRQSYNSHEFELLLLKVDTNAEGFAATDCWSWELSLKHSSRKRSS